MILHKVDPETGLFQEDAILNAHPTLDDGTPDPAYIETPVPPEAGFVLPRWNGATWVEGGTPPDPVTPEPTLEERTAALEAAMLDLILGGAI
jgi:hypothetical protein